MTQILVIKVLLLNQKISKLNFNSNFIFNLSWDGIDFVLVHPPTRDSSEKLQVQLQLQL